ncbi:hypothetical protein SAMN05518855_102219 [Paenibacillus sp. CF384]|nr:hypothetical protein SAMN05518855_102219 [Paenibacillus sp. CF384]
MRVMPGYGCRAFLFSIKTQVISRIRYWYAEVVVYT